MFLDYFRYLLCIKAVHNSKTKSSGIILIPWAMFVPIFVFLMVLVSEAVCGEECAHYTCFGLFWCFFLKFCHN